MNEELYILDRTNLQKKEIVDEKIITRMCK